MKQTHTVHFYKDMVGLNDRLAAYVETGLSEGGSVIVISRPSMLGHLKARWLPLFQERFLGLDAAKTLSQFMRDGKPDRGLFLQVIGGYVAEFAHRTPQVYAFGEMVALLWEEQNYYAAYQLEALWNELGAQYPLTSLCACSWDAFTGMEDADEQNIYEAHEGSSQSDRLSIPPH